MRVSYYPRICQSSKLERSGQHRLSAFEINCEVNFVTYLGHKIFIDEGYPAIYLPTHHLAKQNGTVRIHMLVMEKLLGRELVGGECVHHKDENRLNYCPTNLMCFRTVADHTAYHHGSVPYLCADGVYECRKLKKGTGNCALCGKRITKYARYCRSCASTIQMKGVSRKPSREELCKDLLVLKKYTLVGRKYNVSDRAVRKWCKSYSLPTNRKDLTCWLKRV